MTEQKEYSKSTLIDAVCDLHPDIDHRVVKLIVDSAFNALKTAINIEERVELHGFGVFHVRERAAEEGVMPEGMHNSAGVEFSRPKDYTVEFEPSEDFYALLNEAEA
jgi:nucleoid DNA-binding protein